MKKIIISIIVFIVLLWIFIELVNTGYIYITDQSPLQMKELKKDISNNEKIDFKKVIEEDWDIAIIVTNQNELEIIELYKDKGIINKDCEYPPLVPEFQQFNNIILIKNGVIIDNIVYDRRYYNFICKDNEYFYSTNCIFKVKKGIFKTTFEQI